MTGNLVTFVQNVLQLISGPFGASLMTLAVIGTFVCAGYHFIPIKWGWVTLFCSAFAFSASWIITSVF